MLYKPIFHFAGFFTVFDKIHSITIVYTEKVHLLFAVYIFVHIPYIHWTLHQGSSEHFVLSFGAGK